MDIRLTFDGACLAGIVLDEFLDYPVCTGTIVEQPAIAPWRGYVAALHAADLEFDYCPHHQDEGPYEDTDLAAYVDAMTALRDRLAAGGPVAEPGWPVPSRDPDWLTTYLGFLDHTRWRAASPGATIIVGVPLPPSLDLETKRFAFRP